MKKSNDLKNKKPWYTSKTMWLSIATSITGILLVISNSITETGGDAGILLTVIGLMNGILRVVTHKAII